MKFRKSDRPARAFQPGSDPSEPGATGTDSPGGAQSDPPHPHEISRARRRLRHWRRLLFRTSIRFLVFGFLTLAGVALLLLLNPWSLRLLDERLQRGWVEQTGIPLTYDRATFRLLTGELRIERPRLLDPQSQAPLLELAALRVTMPIAQLLKEQRPLIIEDIDLDGPVTIVVEIAGGRARLSGPMAQLVEAVRARMRDGVARRGGAAGLDRFACRRLGASPVTIRVLESAAATTGTTPTLMATDEPDRGPGARPPRLLGEIRNAKLEATFQDSLLPQLIYISGAFNQHDFPSALRLALRPDFNAQSIGYTLRLDEFASHQDLPVAVPFLARSGVIEMQGAFAWDADKGWSTAGQGTIAQLNLELDGAEPQDLGVVKLGWSLVAPRGEGRLELPSLTLQSASCTLSASGRVETGGPLRFQVQTAPLELRGYATALLAERYLTYGRLLKPGQTTVRADFDVRGDLRTTQGTPRVDSLTGALTTAGVDWLAPALPAPMRNVSGRIQFTTDSMLLEQVRGIVQGIPVELNGRLMGDVLRGQVRLLDLEWRTVGDIQGLNEVLQAQPAGPTADAMRQVELAGDVTGEGWLRVREPLSGGLAEAIQKARLDGRLVIRRGRFFHPLLNKPLENFEGEVQFTPNVMQLKNIKAHFIGTDLHFDGELRGGEKFWEAPQLVGHARTWLDLSQLSRLAGDLADIRPTSTTLRLKRALAELPRVSGSANIELEFAGDLLALKLNDYLASVRIDDARTSLAFPNIRGPVALDALRMTLDPRRLLVSQADGRWQDLELRMSGDLAPAGGRLLLTTSGELAAYKRQLPELLDVLNVDGRATIEHSLLISDERHAVGSWLDALERFRGRNDPAVELGEHAAAIPLLDHYAGWNLSHSGTIELTNAEITYYAMPQPLRGITARLRYDNDRLWSEAAFPVDDGAGARNLLGSIDVLWPRDTRPLTFNFAVAGERLDLTPWVGRWHFDPARRRDWPDGVEYRPGLPRKFQLRGQFNLGELEIFRIVARDTTGTLEDALYHDQPGMLRWRGVRGTAYGGPTDVEGQVFNNAFVTTITTARVALPELMAAIAPETYKGQGIYSGVLGGRVVLSRQLDADPPEKLAARGDIEITQSRFVANKLFGGLGRIVNLPLFEDINFSRIYGPFEYREGQARSDGLIFDNPVMNVKATGAYGPARQLDLSVQLQFLRIVEGVPLLDQAMSVFNSLVGKVLRFRISGTLDDPTISPL